MGLSDELATFECLLAKKQVEKSAAYLKSMMENLKISL